MKPIGYYCNTTDSISLLVKQFGEHLEELSQVEKIDLLYSLVQVLWDSRQLWKINAQRSEDAYNLIKGQSERSLIELCTALITYIQEGDRQVIQEGNDQARAAATEETDGSITDEMVDDLLLTANEVAA